MQPFELVVEEYGAMVYRVCRALLDPVDADDAWSETFLSALRAYPRLRPDSNTEGWLATIAHRKALDVLRRRARGAEVAGGAAQLDTATSDEPAEPLDDRLQAAVRALPPKQQAAVIHHYLADLPYRDVAELLGTSTDAARRSAADGIAALRAVVARPEPLDGPPVNPVRK